MTEQQFIQEIETELGSDIEEDSQIHRDVIECFLDGSSVEETIDGLDLRFHFAPVTESGGFFPIHDKEHWFADRHDRMGDFR